jgi:cobalt-zinc-cadmium efflux system protein
MKDAGGKKPGGPCLRAFDKMAQRTDTARGDDGNSDGTAHRAEKVEVEATARAVPVHARQQDFTRAHDGHALAPSDGIQPRRRAAAMAVDFPAAGSGGTRIDRHDHALIAKFFRRLIDEFGVDAALVGAGQQQAAHIAGGTNSAADRQGQKYSLSRFGHDIEDRIAIFVACGNVQKSKLICPRGIIKRSLLNRVTGVSERNEIDTLHYPPVFHVQAGNHAQLQHGTALFIVPVFWATGRLRARESIGASRIGDCAMSTTHGQSGHDHDHDHDHNHEDHEHDDHGHDHAGHSHAGHSHAGHSHAPANFGRAFLIGIVLNVGFVFAEVIYGVLGHSMALIADGAHNLTDVLGLAAAWLATVLAKRPPSSRYTYGMGRSTILAALSNGVLLLVATGAILLEAVQRLIAPAPVAGGTVMIVALIGIVINGVSAWLFMSGAKDDINIKGAFQHMLADALVSVGVVVAALAISLTGWNRIDPAVSIVISIVIVVGTWGLLRQSLGMSLDAVPEGVDPAEVRRYLEALPGVTEVHDLHIWAMSTTDTALTGHLVIPGAHPGDSFLRSTCEELQRRFRIGHATLQIEIEVAGACRLAPADVV